MKKTIVALATVLATSLSLTGTALAKSATPTKGVAQFSLGSGQVYCYNHTTDVCIMNKSDQPISYRVPTLGYTGPIYPHDWIDAYDSDYYSSLFVAVYNASGNQIFAQNVPNHAVIKITPDRLAKGSKAKKLVATIL